MTESDQRASIKKLIRRQSIYVNITCGAILLLFLVVIFQPYFRWLPAIERQSYLLKLIVGAITLTQGLWMAFTNFCAQPKIIYRIGAPKLLFAWMSKLDLDEWNWWQGTKVKIWGIVFCLIGTIFFLSFASDEINRQKRGTDISSYGDTTIEFWHKTTTNPKQRQNYDIIATPTQIVLTIPGFEVPILRKSFRFSQTDFQKIMSLVEQHGITSEYRYIQNKPCPLGGSTDYLTIRKNGVVVLEASTDICTSGDVLSGNIKEFATALKQFVPNFRQYVRE